jgi:hypothetical protein
MLRRLNDLFLRPVQLGAFFGQRLVTRIYPTSLNPNSPDQHNRNQRSNVRKHERWLIRLLEIGGFSVLPDLRIGDSQFRSQFDPSVVVIHWLVVERPVSYF